MNDLLKKMHFAFNVWDFESAKAVMDAGERCRKDVILQTSASIYKRIPANVFSEFVKMYSREIGIKVWLNLDHCKDFDLLINAIDNGWDMVMADGSSLGIDDNIRFINQISQYAHKKGALVEGEVGQIKGVEDEIRVIEDGVASKEDIELFASQADVDFLAVAFGNAHGDYKTKPIFRYDLIDYTVGISKKPFVVHGASGMTAEVINRIVSINEVKKINFSTDIKNAYRMGISKTDNDMQPIDISKEICNEIMDEVITKYKIIK